VIEHREALIYMLCEAAELEHGIMCQYLFAGNCRAELSAGSPSATRARCGLRLGRFPHRDLKVDDRRAVDRFQYSHAQRRGPRSARSSTSSGSRARTRPWPNSIRARLSTGSGQDRGPLGPS
jgi:hypothetical protein